MVYRSIFPDSPIQYICVVNKRVYELRDHSKWVYRNTNYSTTEIPPVNRIKLTPLEIVLFNIPELPND